MLTVTLLYFSSKGLPSSSTFTLEEGTIYLTSEPNALEIEDDNASVLDVYLVSSLPFLSLPCWFTHAPSSRFTVNKFCEARRAWVLTETGQPVTSANSASFHNPSFMCNITQKHV